MKEQNSPALGIFILHFWIPSFGDFWYFWSLDTINLSQQIYRIWSLSPPLQKFGNQFGKFWSKFLFVKQIFSSEA